MDPIMMQKFQAIKKSKNYKKQHQLQDKFLLYTFMAITCSIFCSSPFWLPWLFSSMKGFFLIYFPKISSIFDSPKLLFIVGNLIVVILIGESKFFGSGSSVAEDNYYDDYVDRSRRIRNSSSTMEVKKVKKLKPVEENMEKGRPVVAVKGRLVEEIIQVKKEKIDLQGEEHELVLPTEELKKRADDLIARVNRQRRSELKLHY